MKRVINVSLVFGILIFILCSITRVNGSGRFELVKQPQPSSQSLLMETVKPGLYESKLGIHNCTTGAGLDINKNEFCFSYTNTIDISIPEEDSYFYLKTYYQIKNDDGNWGEWIYLATSPTYFITSENSYTYYYIEFFMIFLKEEGVSFKPSEGQFMIEMYNPDGMLLDTFITNNDYWPPRLETEDYDMMPYISTPTPTPTSAETLTPVDTPTPTPTATPVTVGSIFGIISNEKGKLLYNAKVTATSDLKTLKTKTDKDGQYVFEGLDLRAYTVTVKKTSYCEASVGINLNAAEEDLNFILKKDKK